LSAEGLSIERYCWHLCSCFVREVEWMTLMLMELSFLIYRVAMFGMT